MKELTDRELRIKKAKKYLNKNFKQGWGLRWKDGDKEVKVLATLFKDK